MCTPLLKRVVCIAVAAGLTGCGGDGLTLPGGEAAPVPPPVDGAPAILAVYAGNGQEGTVGKRLEEPLVVRLTDAGSRPVPDVTIVFRFQSDIPGAEVDPEAVTNDEGFASAKVRLGESAGSQPVEAQVLTASSLRATFDVTAVAKDKGSDGDDDDD